MAGINNDKVFGTSAAFGSSFQSLDAPGNGGLFQGKVRIARSATTNIGPSALEVFSANAKTTTAFDQVSGVYSNDSTDPLSLVFGLQTHATATSRYASIECTEGGATKRPLALQAFGGNVGIGFGLAASRLGVTGNLAVGATFGALAAPTSGAIIEGNVGIGTSSLFNLLANTPTNLTPTGTGVGVGSRGLLWENNGVGFSSVIYNSAGSSTANGLGVSTLAADSGSYIAVFQSNSINRMTIRADGNVGIGLIAPVSKLHVFQNDAEVGDAAGLTIQQSGAGDAIAQYLLTGAARWITGVDNSDSDKFKIAASVDVGTATVMTMTLGGNVGIGTATPNALLDIQGSQAWKITVPGAYPYSILSTDYLIAVDTSSARSVILPTSAAANSGVHYVIKDVIGSAAANNITVTVNGGGNIDGAASFVINIAYGSARFYSNGTQWFTG